MKDREVDIKTIQANNPHLVTFIKKVREEYGKYILNDHFYRQSVIYICRMFNGLNTHEIRSVMQAQSRGVSVDTQTALELHKNNHPGFMEIYNPLLQLYIDSTREFLESRRNGAHLSLSEHQRLHKN